MRGHRERQGRQQRGRHKKQLGCPAQLRRPTQTPQLLLLQGPGDLQAERRGRMPATQLHAALHHKAGAHLASSSVTALPAPAAAAACRAVPSPSIVRSTSAPLFRSSCSEEAGGREGGCGCNGACTAACDASSAASLMPARDGAQQRRGHCRSGCIRSALRKPHPPAAVQWCIWCTHSRTGDGPGCGRRMVQAAPVVSAHLDAFRLVGRCRSVQQAAAPLCRVHRIHIAAGGVQPVDKGAQGACAGGSGGAVGGRPAARARLLGAAVAAAHAPGRPLCACAHDARSKGGDRGARGAGVGLRSGHTARTCLAQGPGVPGVLARGTAHCWRVREAGGRSLVPLHSVEGSTGQGCSVCALASRSCGLICQAPPAPDTWRIPAAVARRALTSLITPSQRATPGQRLAKRHAVGVKWHWYIGLSQMRCSHSREARLPCRADRRPARSCNGRIKPCECDASALHSAGHHFSCSHGLEPKCGTPPVVWGASSCSCPTCCPQLLAIATAGRIAAGPTWSVAYRRGRRGIRFGQESYRLQQRSRQRGAGAARSSTEGRGAEQQRGSRGLKAGRQGAQGRPCQRRAPMEAPPSSQPRDAPAAAAATGCCCSAAAAAASVWKPCRCLCLGLSLQLQGGAGCGWCSCGWCGGVSQGLRVFPRCDPSSQATES